jgi:hypothetical protein
MSAKRQLLPLELAVGLPQSGRSAHRRSKPKSLDRFQSSFDASRHDVVGFSRTAAAGADRTLPEER